MKRRSTLQLFAFLALPACDDSTHSPSSATAPPDANATNTSAPTAATPTAATPTAATPTAATPTAGPSYDDPISAILSVPRADVAAGAAGDYRMHGDGDDHDHNVHLETKHMLALRNAQDLVVRSGPASTDGHLHWVRVTQATS